MRERPKNALTANRHNPSRQAAKTQKRITALFARTYGQPGGMVIPEGDHVVEIGCVTGTATERRQILTQRPQRTLRTA